MKSFESQAAYVEFCRTNLAVLEAALAEGRSGPLADVSVYGLQSESDEQLLRQYTRCHEGELQVLAELLWDGHHNVPRWESTDLGPAEILEDPRYFARCLWCGRRTHQGHMGSDQVCCGCQEYFFGVRY